MPSSPYTPVFAVTGRAPYLGRRPECVDYFDLADAPDDARDIWFNKKVKNIERLPELTELRAVRTDLVPDWLPMLAALPKLEIANFNLPRSGDIPSLAPLSALRTLVLSCNKHQTSLDFLRDCTGLQSLCVSEAMGVTTFEPLAELTELRELYIDGKIGGRYTVESLEPLATLTELRYVVLLVRIAKQNRTLKPLHSWKRLTTLTVSHDYSPEEYDALLAALPELKRIGLNAGRYWPPE